MKEEKGPYPTSWSEFIGQDIAKTQIRTAAKSARMRKAPADHILLAHPDPGVGKTALARLAAKEMGREVHEVSGRITIGEIRLLLSGMADRDVLWWDEFHQAVDGGKRHVEWMLPFLVDWMLTGPFGTEPQPHVTVIAATTDLHRLPPALVSRFNRPPMVGYTLEEATRIAVIMCRKLLVSEGLPKISRRNAVDIAACANENPRSIRKLLLALRDLSIVSNLANHDGRDYDLSALFLYAGLTPDGLDFAAQAYLRALLKVNGELGEQALRSMLMEPSLVAIERVLHDRGYILKTKTGRTLTQLGLVRAKELAA